MMTRPAPYYNVGLTEKEMDELILLIDDEPLEKHPIDEDLLRQIRVKLADKRRELRKRVRNGTYS